MNWSIILIVFLTVETIMAAVLTVIILKKDKKSDGIMTVDLSGENVPIQIKMNIGINDIIKKKSVVLKTEMVNLEIPTKIEDD